MPGKIPSDKYININTVTMNIDNCINDFMALQGIENDYKTRINIKHQTVNALFIYIYERLFKPDITLCNNQRSYVDYNNIQLLQVLADKYINICQYFNKSLGLMSFAYMIGANYSTIYNWLNNPDGDELSRARFEVLKSIQESHKVAQISLLNDTPVGALAVANNDRETGLNWAANQAQQIGATAVYILPSERADRLKLGKDQELQEITAPEG